MDATDAIEWAEDSCLFLEQLRSLSSATFTKATVCAIVSKLIAGKKKKKKDANMSWRHIKECLMPVFGDQLHEVTEMNLRTNFLGVYEEKMRKAKDKTKGDKFQKVYDNFLAKRHELPGCIPFDFGRQSNSAVRKELKRITPTFDEGVQQLVVNKFIEDSDKISEVNLELQRNVHVLKRKLKVLEQKQSTTRKAQLERKRINEDRSRLRARVRCWKTKYSQASRRAALADQQVAKLEKRLGVYRSKLVRVKSKQHVKVEEKRVEMNYDESLLSELNKLRDELREGKQSIQCLQDELDQSEARVVELRKDATPTRKDGKTFAYWVREASYYLQDQGMAEAKTSEALRKVYTALTGKELLGELPSSKTQHRFGAEMKTLARQQVKEALSTEENTSLKYDGTTKAGHHLVEMEISTQARQYLIGLKEQEGGTAAEYHATLIEALHDTEATATTEPLECKLLYNISNTMSDRVVTNKCIENLLAADKGGELINLKCAIHPLDTFAKDCEKKVFMFEKERNFQDPGMKLYKRASESYTQALERAVDKLFHNDQYNTYGKDLSRHLRDKLVLPDNEVSDGGNSKVLYHRWVGSRFHVYFLDAGLIYFYRNTMKDFFQSVKTPTNPLPKAIHEWLSSESLDPVLRALGLVGKFVTGPWMRFIPTLKCNLDLNPHLHTATMKIDEWITDPASLLDGTTSPIFPTTCLKDRVFDCLVQPQGEEKDGLCSLLLKIFLQTIKDVILRQMSDQLPGGKFWDPSPELYERAKSCGPDNISGERRFGMVDAYMRRAPNASSEKVEAKVMFKGNQTAGWMEEQSNDNKRKIIELAVKETGKQLVVEKKQRLDRIESHREKLKAARRQLSEKEEKKRQKTENIVEDMIDLGGLWLATSIENELTKLKSKTRKIAALKVQIQVWHKFLIDGKLGVSLSKGTLEELTEYLLQLVSSPVSEEKSNLFKALVDYRSLIGSHFSQKWTVTENTDNVNVTFWKGKICDVVECEFQIVYINDDAEFYLTPAEVVTDLILGDLSLLHAD